MARQTMGPGALLAAASVAVLAMGCSDDTGNETGGGGGTSTGSESTGGEMTSGSGGSAGGSLGGTDPGGVVTLEWGVHSIAESLGISDAAAGDLDQDGDVDVAVLTGGGQETGWLENVDAGSEFVWHPIAEDADASIWDTRIKTVDVDGDGDLDILASFEDGTIRLWRNDGAASDLWTAEVVAPDFQNVFDFTVWDVDVDGRLDVVGVARSGSDPGLRYYSPPASPGAPWTETAIEEARGGSYTTVKVFDSPVRDAPELLLMGSSVVRFTRNSDGTWEEAEIPTWCRNTFDEELDLSDVDHDGDLDILCADGSDIYFCENLDGDFGDVAQHFVAGLWNHSNEVGADIDGDGYREVLTANVGNCILQNPTTDWDSGAEWARSCLPGVEGSSLLRLDAADFDGDGDLDIYGTDAIGSDDAFPWFENPRL